MTSSMIEREIGEGNNLFQFLKKTVCFVLLLIFVLTSKNGANIQNSRYLLNTVQGDNYKWDSFDYMPLAEVELTVAF